MKTYTYVVTWRVEVTASSPQDAAKQARGTMIDPGRTQATFQVARKLDDNSLASGRFKECGFYDAQDPDRSGE